MLNQAGKYIGPNEHLGHIYNSILKKLSPHGAIISVGTIRSIDRSARLRRALGRGKTFLLDYDGVTTGFNEALIDRLKAVPKRQALLSELFHGQVPPSTSTGWKAKLAIDQATVGSGDVSPSWPGRKSILDPSHVASNFHTFATQPGTWRRSFLGSERLFGIAKAQAERGELIAINGSIAGDHAMPDIAAALHAGGEKVSVIDFSNALQYVFRQSPQGTIQKVIENLERLPLADDAQILLTGLDYGKTREPSPWKYYAVAPKDFLAAARRGMFQHELSYQSFLQLARKHRKPGPAELVVPTERFAAAIEAFRPPQ